MSKSGVDLLRALESLVKASKSLDDLAAGIFDKDQQAQAYDILDLIEQAKIYIEHDIRRSE
jgi:hypothetical protein